MVTSDARQPTNPIDNKDFRLKEFEVVRNEHDALDARLITIIQYLLLISAVIYPFLLGRKPGMPVERWAYTIVWCVPSFAAVVGGAILWDIENKIKKTDQYLFSVETIFTVSGWEHFRSLDPPHWLLQVKTLLPGIIAVIVLLNIAAAVLGIRYNFALPPSAVECGV
jgi:hypothetical protein